jgi:hypothetical protein
MRTLKHDTARFANGMCGPEAISAAVTALLSDEGWGTVQRLTLANHTLAGSTATNNYPGLVHETVTIGLGDVDGLPCLRYVGENGNPDGAGSSSVIGSYDPGALDAHRLTALLAFDLGRKCAKYGPDCWMFREEIDRPALAH